MMGKENIRSIGSNWTSWPWKDLVAASSRRGKKGAIYGRPTMPGRLVILYYRWEEPGIKSSEICSKSHSSWATELSFELGSLQLLPTSHHPVVPLTVVQACDLENAWSPLLLTGHEVQLPADVFFLESLTSPCLLFDPESSSMWRLHLATASGHTAYLLVGMPKADSI